MLAAQLKPTISPEPHLLDIEDSPRRVRCVLVLRGITDQTLLVREGHVRRSDTVTLIVHQNLDLSVLHHTDTRVGCSQIDTDNCFRALVSIVINLLFLQ